MKKNIIIIILCTIALVSCKKDFLEKPPLDQLDDETFFVNESNVRTFAYSFYVKTTTHPDNEFNAYGSGNTWGAFFSGQSLNDDFAPGTPTEYTRVVPASEKTKWNFEVVRRANYFIEKVQSMPVSDKMSDEAKMHWTGIGRFFRGLEYYSLVKRYGDIPWFDKALAENESDEIYRPRDPRSSVMDKVLEDFKYAVQNVRVNDGTKGLTVNKYVVLAFMSRVFLFEGTWQKYHENNNEKAKEYLEAAKWAATQVISSNIYSLGNYRSVFSSLDLTGNPEVIMFRQYVDGVLTHNLMTYNNKEPQTGASKDLIESYLASDGLPIKISNLYQGDRTIVNVMANRDPRLSETFAPDLRISGEISNYSTTGYASRKFLNESIKDQNSGTLALNPTDAPIIRYGEVLVNYAEASAELATVGGDALSNADLDKSINVLRSRSGINMPRLTLEGDKFKVNGIVYDDPDRDPTVPSVIWEIRRERRIELVFEGFRWDDLRRWKKGEYTDTEANPDINRGMWIKKSEHPNMSASIILNKDQNVTEGYITPAWNTQSVRRFSNPRVYLSPVPQDQIVLYKEHGVELKQNPGWE
ncbi:RagB/SusD family nutrient uptake outer membrane protein [Pararcticibacter amylolyticus]|uniref:RagB/SusD family nutrient uptake outer membrane protein n=1 Tax=Pararcticibacter amylolyticus TaxID=2173175 RepID=A0A2U2PH81_9SPHI|nr:RagB/SusD family nutrient uptake outer membrane protein [Pararcticibacter amylolyticus]PWG80768.1 RagB/SusD family nutrient uptake outer membrane protein [Pararcticibacter amylolyticus]